MKKQLTLVLSLLLLLSCFAFPSSAQTDAVSVSVSIANAGTLVLTQKNVTVTDIDTDGAITLNDALYAAHEAAYEGGAAAGYSTYESEYGLSLGLLWGNDSGSFGYYCNHTASMSLVDPVKNGDQITAFIYTDTATFSDVYTFFDKDTVAAKKNEEITLTLSASGYDENWNPVTTPLAGAAVTVDGVKTDLVTNADGTVTLTLKDSGTHIISASSDAQTIVPPVCSVVIEQTENPLPTTTIAAMIVLLVLFVLGLITFYFKRRRHTS